MKRQTEKTAWANYASAVLFAWLLWLQAVVASASPGIVGGWGDNSNGQLSIPNGAAGLSNVIAVSAGGSYSLALRSDKTVMAWGYGGNGNLNIPAGLSNVVAISAGNSHSLALKVDGTVVAWGLNQVGQLAIPPSLSNVKAISAGSDHSLALKADGTVVAWGYNYQGQVTGTPSNDFNPATANPVAIGGQVLSGVVAIAAGASHSLALKIDGTVVAWGLNGGGQTNIPSGLTNVVFISAGNNHNLAINGDGTVSAWGDNTYGATSVPTGLTNVTAVAAGGRFSLALKVDGSVVGWGDDSNGAVSGGVGLKDIGAISASYAQCLAIGPGPFIVQQPTSITVLERTNVTVSVSASSLNPLAFQWRFNGLNIVGATNANLVLTNISLNQSGNYSVIVSNSSGSAVTSKSAKVKVNPANDFFSMAQSLPSIGGRFYGSTSAATKELGEPNHADNPGGKSIWFSWVAPANGSVTMDTIGSDFDTLLAVYTGTSLTNLLLIAADDDSGIVRGNSKLSMTAVQGTFYYIAVDGFPLQVGGVASGGVVLNITPDRPIIGNPSSLSAQSGFQIQFSARPNSSAVLQVSADLKTWFSLTTNSVPDEGVLTVSDTQATNLTRRFYRVLNQ